MDIESSSSLNNRPIIGILSQELTPLVSEKYPGKTSYIAASYVKYIEGAGGRVIPILIGKETKYYKDILSKINGVLFPGGATYFDNPHGYGDAGEKIYNIAMNMNDQGIYTPIWGTCLGFELLSYLSANKVKHLIDCDSENQLLPLKLIEKNLNKSKLFKNIPETILNTLKNENTTINVHKYCVTPKAFEELNLDRLWRVLSVNYDNNNIEFISTMEHKQYPFYGVQFHPEKNIYEFIKNRNYSHTSTAVEASQYFANFFVNETRKNPNTFSTDAEEMKYLIYNYNPEFTGSKGLVFEQAYFF